MTTRIAYDNAHKSLAVPCGAFDLSPAVACVRASCSRLAIVKIGSAVSSIGGGAFEQCYNLTHVDIPNGVTSIGGSGFFQSGLTSITIRDSVMNIGDSAFGWCIQMTNVTVGSGVTSIGSGAFEMCRGLNRIYFTDSQWPSYPRRFYPVRAQ